MNKIPVSLTRNDNIDDSVLLGCDAAFWVWGYWGVKGSWCFYLQGQAVQELDCLTLKMKVPWSFATSETTLPMTHRHIPGAWIFSITDSTTSSLTIITSTMVQHKCRQVKQIQFWWGVRVSGMCLQMSMSQRHIPEDLNPQKQCCENLRSHILKFILFINSRKEQRVLWLPTLPIINDYNSCLVLCRSKSEYSDKIQLVNVVGSSAAVLNYLKRKPDFDVGKNMTTIQHAKGLLNIAPIPVISLKP